MFATPLGITSDATPTECSLDNGDDGADDIADRDGLRDGLREAASPDRAVDDVHASRAEEECDLAQAVVDD